MKRTLAGLLVAVALVVGSPRALTAQCDGDCLVITNIERTIVFSCFHAPGSGIRCTSLGNGCRLVMCETALLADAIGRRFAMDSCGGKRSIRAVADESANAKEPVRRGDWGRKVRLGDARDGSWLSRDVLVESS